MELQTYCDNRFGDCLRLSDTLYEIVVALEFGIRIMHFSKRGHENLLFVQPDDMLDLTVGDWRNRGGHRVWIAPESELSYFPDNAGITYQPFDKGVLITQAIDTWLNIEKSMRVTFDGGKVMLAHIVRNVSDANMRFSVWPITSLVPGGVVEIPFTSKTDNIYNPNRNLSLWGDSALCDEQLSFHENQMQLSHQCKDKPMKIGVFVKEGMAKYKLQGCIFTKTFSADTTAQYPDGNVNCEVYLCKHMVEVESLSPLMAVGPGESVVHTESWII